MQQHHLIPASDEIAVLVDALFTINFAVDPDGGYVVTSPDLPGVAAHGKTLRTARISVRAEIIKYLDEGGMAGALVPLLRYATPASTWLRHRGHNRPPDGLQGL